MVNTTEFELDIFTCPLLKFPNRYIVFTGEVNKSDELSVTGDVKTNTSFNAVDIGVVELSK